MDMSLTLPRAADPGRKMTSDLRSPREDRRRHGQGRSEGEDSSSRAAISTNVVLVGSELSAFARDTLQILLSWSVGIANLEEEALFADGLAVELSDDLIADLTALETTTISQSATP